jgi:hypothetical protein
MYTLLYTAYILFQTLFFEYVKMRELFGVTELGGTLCIIGHDRFLTLLLQCPLSSSHLIKSYE